MSPAMTIFVSGVTLAVCIATVEAEGDTGEELDEGFGETVGAGDPDELQAIIKKDDVAIIKKIPKRFLRTTYLQAIECQSASAAYFARLQPSCR